MPPLEEDSPPVRIGPKRAASNRRERDQVILENLHLVRAIAARVHDNLPVHIELEDLVHAGVLGLIDAASKFDPAKQVTFSSYAKHRIKGAILDSLRQLDWASRDMRRRFKRVEQAIRELMLALGREPGETEIAAKLGISVEEWRQVSLELQQIEIVSADTRAVEFEDCPQLELADRGEEGPDATYHRGEMSVAIRDALGTLPDRYRQVMQLYYTEELTMKEIGGMMGINESRVSQIHKAALEKLQLTLVANGITRRHALAG